MIIENGKIRAVIESAGAELTSLKKTDSAEELIWKADKEYWGRHAPMLFPIVGKVWNGQYKADGSTYCLPQHGFARDREFTLLCHDTESAVFCLESDEESLKVYPYKFRLEATYRLEDTSLITEWRIKNTGNTALYYQIGAHPGFNFRNFSKEDSIHGFFRLTLADEPASQLVIGLLTPQGYRSEQAAMLSLDSDAMLPITPGLFENDALVLEGNQIDQVILYDKDCNPYIALDSSDAKVWGLWSPPTKNAPFVCIEPWLGRCDTVGYDGDISSRDYINLLEAGKSAAFRFRITVI